MSNKQVINLTVSKEQFPQWLAFQREQLAVKKSKDERLERKLDAIITKLEGLGAIVVQLNNLQQSTERIETFMATVNEQIAQLTSEVDALGMKIDENTAALAENNVALDAEIVQVQAALAQLQTENPALAAAIGKIQARAANAAELTTAAKALTEKIHGIIADAPIVPSVPADAVAPKRNPRR